MSLRNRHASSGRWAILVVLLALASSLPLALAVVDYPPAPGLHKVVVVTVEFSDEKPEFYPPVSQIEGVIEMVSDHFLELSYGEIWLEAYVTNRFYEIGAMSYYEEMGSPGTSLGLGGPNVPIVADAVMAADPDVDYSRYDHVVVLLITPDRFGWWITCPNVYTYPWHDLRVETNDGVAVESGILIQGQPTGIPGWVNIFPFSGWASRLGMIMGLPEDTRYIAGFENLHSVHHHSPSHMPAWEKMALGWISPD